MAQPGLQPPPTAQHQLLLRVIDAVPSAVAHTDVSGSVVLANAAWASLTGAGPLGHVDDLVAAVADQRQLAAALGSARMTGRDMDVEVVFTSAGSGEAWPGVVRIRPLAPVPAGGLVLVVDTAQSAGMGRSAPATVAGRDPLTGVLDRWGVLDRLAPLLAAGSGPVSVVACDIVGIGAINEHHGEVVGDELIRRVAAALEETVRNNDLVGRLGGDNLIVVLVGSDTDRASEVAVRISQRVAGRTGDLFVGAVALSFGVAGAEPNDDPEGLVARAEALLTGGPAQP